MDVPMKGLWGVECILAVVGTGGPEGPGIQSGGSTPTPAGGSTNQRATATRLDLAAGRRPKSAADRGLLRRAGQAGQAGQAGGGEGGAASPSQANQRSPLVTAEPAHVVRARQREAAVKIQVRRNIHFRSLLVTFGHFRIRSTFGQPTRARASAGRRSRSGRPFERSNRSNLGHFHSFGPALSVDQALARGHLARRQLTGGQVAAATRGHLARRSPPRGSRRSQQSRRGGDEEEEEEEEEGGAESEESGLYSEEDEEEEGYSDEDFVELDDEDDGFDSENDFERLAQVRNPKNS
eukprot:1187440-Prorocentrum_minimum.AAC.1